MRNCWRTANNVVKTMPSTIPKITINRRYVYHSQSWVVYDIVLTTLPEYISGWWFQSLWKICKSMGRIIPNILWKIKAMFETTNQMGEWQPYQVYIRIYQVYDNHIRIYQIFNDIQNPVDSPSLMPQRPGEAGEAGDTAVSRVAYWEWNMGRLLGIPQSPQVTNMV